MKAQLKALHSPDALDLRSYVPSDTTDFGIFVQAMIGPEGTDDAESFGFMLCTPKWLARRLEQQPVILGAHHVIVGRYDHSTLLASLAAYCGASEAEDWSELAAKLSRLGEWEFEGYRE